MFCKKGLFASFPIATGMLTEARPLLGVKAFTPAAGPPAAIDGARGDSLPSLRIPRQVEA